MQVANFGLFTNLEQMQHVQSLLTQMLNGREDAPFPDCWQRGDNNSIDAAWRQRRYRFDERSRDVFCCKSAILSILHTVASMHFEEKVNKVIQVFETQSANPDANFDQLNRIGLFEAVHVEQMLPSVVDLVRYELPELSGKALRLLYKYTFEDFAEDLAAVQLWCADDDSYVRTQELMTNLRYLIE